MNAILLSAGYGKRLKPITNTIPKCLVPINNKPLLQIWIELLLDSNLFEKIIINTHYLSECVTNFLETQKYKNKIVVYHEPNLLGTGGTLLANSSFFNETFFVAHADNLSKFDIVDFYNYHLKRKPHSIATLMSFITDTPSSCGIFELDSNNILKNFYEKVKSPPSKLANAAVYFFEPIVINLLKKINKNNPDISCDLLPQLLNKSQVYFNNSYHRDIGTVDSYNQALRDFSND